MIHLGKKVPIFKYGAQTNLTMGYIKTIDMKVKLDNTSYSNTIEVEWIDNIEFAQSGDSGSLYFLYDSTTNTFVPVAMHVGSKENHSYGIFLYYIFHELNTGQYEFLICNSTYCQED
ncbi:unnamed protein product [Rotaria sordida]|uniref:Uncharacterized protein n=1 Tax=Rotaria sordida TaxID=392033 RepID=A0A816CA29_9BILA|nr:unnamed protein product [Rotaria sordida]CAF1620182.1 unnamed protein product [Rotaria sordida]